MSAAGKEYKIAIRIAGIVDKSYDVALVGANTRLKAFQATMKKIDGTFTEMDKGFNKIMSAGRTCFGVVAKAAGVAAVGVGAVTAASIKLGSEFEAEMSTVQAISGATTDELSKLSEKARETAKTTVYSATEIGSAMEYMGMAGWKPDQIMAGIDGIVAIAAASGEEISMVSDIVTDTLTAMGETADQSTRFADIMAQAAMNSNTNVELMGETFKYAAPVAGAMSYSMEDLAIATGLMASSGIKGSLAGTALRNMLTRMAKPTKESQDAMDKLGLSLEDDTGRMYSLMEIMQILRKNFSETADIGEMQQALIDLAGLTDEQVSEIQEGLGDLSEAEEAFYAAELGGLRGMSGLLAIANSPDDEFYKLTDAIYNAEGAAEQMSKIRLDNLQGDVTILKDTLSDAGIELYYQFNTELRESVQKVTEFAGTLAAKIPSAFRKISAEFPTIKRKFTTYAEPVFNGMLTAGKWMIQHGRGIISVISGIGAALATYKVMSDASHLVTAIVNIMALGPAGAVILGLATAIAAVTAAIVSYNLKRQELKDNSLAEHFGNIALSLKDLQAAAEYIVGSDALDGVHEALKAFSDLDTMNTEIEDIVEEINKANWKISIGMELSEDEQDTYKENIAAYVEKAQEYAEQARYAVTLNMAIAFPDDYLEGSNVVAQVDQFYADKYDELADLGTQLNEALTDAFNDGLLDIDETKKIADLQRQMADIQEALAVGEMEARFSLLGQQFSGANLTPEAFQNLQEEIEKQVLETNEAFGESYVRNYQALAASGADQSAFDALELKYLQDTSDAQMRAFEFQMNTIRETYGDKLDEADAYTQAVMDEWFLNGRYDRERAAGRSDLQLFYDMANEMKEGGADMDAVNELLLNMTSQYNELLTTQQKFLDAGAEVPSEISQALEEYEKYYTLSSGGYEGLEYIGRMIAEHPEYQEELENLGVVGEMIPQEVADGIMENADAVDAATLELYDYTQSSLNDTFSDPLKVNAAVDINLNPWAMNANSDLEIDPSWLAEASDAWNTAHPSGHANGGLVMDKELSWLAEKGPEMVVPLDGSDRAVSLWEQAGELLGMSSLSDRYDLDGATQQTVTVEYSPTLQFYGQAPAKEDLDEALRMSQEEFNEMMENYLSDNRRVSF